MKYYIKVSSPLPVTGLDGVHCWFYTYDDETDDLKGIKGPPPNCFIDYRTCKLTNQIEAGLVASYYFHWNIMSEEEFFLLML